MNLLRPRQFALFFSLVALLSLGVSAHAQSYTSIVVFGDSFSDTGNDAHLSGTSGARYPGPTYNYTNGRFTDGTDTAPQAVLYTGTWIEQLAAMLSAKPPVTDSLDGGTNHAYGGATTTTGNVTVTYATNLSVTAEGCGHQIADYLATKPTITSSTLFVVWCGASDVLAGASTAAANADVTNIQTLITAGATDFLIPDVPPMGSAPKYNTSTTNSATYNSLAANFNGTLSSGVAAIPANNATKTLRLYYVDVYSLFQAIYGTPSFFNLTNVTQVSQGATTVNPDNYLYWDNLYPTASGHHQIALFAKNALTAATASTVSLALSTNTFLSGQTVGLTATVASGATAVKTVPTGSVTFFNGSTPIATVALSASGVATSSLIAGAVSSTGYSITAQYNGDATFLSNLSAPQTFVVITTPVTTTGAVTSSASSVNLGTSVTLTATISSLVGAPTGTVTFLDAALTVLGTGTLTPSTGFASTTTYTTSAFTAGTHYITAAYTPTGTTFNPSLSPVFQQVIVPPSVSLSISPLPLTIASGSTGTATLTATPFGGLTATYALTCGTLPADISCSFATPSLAFTGGSTALTSVVTIGTKGSASLGPKPLSRPSATAFGIVSALLLPSFFLFSRKRRSQIPRLYLLALLAVLSLGASFGLSGCSGSSSTSAPAGTYYVVINATPSGGAAATSLTVTVMVH